MKKVLITILTLFLWFSSTAQKEDWIRFYWEYKHDLVYDLIETYDNGYILCCVVRPDNLGIKEIWTWIIKTDINGEVLWEKKIGNGVDLTGLHYIAQTPDGGYILSGATTYLDNAHGDTFFVKLNACGEKEWCRIFHLAGPTTSFDFGQTIYPLPNEEGYIALVTQWGDDYGPGVFKGIWLFKLDMEGKNIWMKNVFDQVDPNAWNEFTYFMNIAEDGTLILTNETIYNDYGGEVGHDKPFISAAYPDGTEKWWTIFGANSEYIGIVTRSVLDKNSNTLSVGWSDYIGLGEGYYPSLLKTSKNGEQIFAKDIFNNTIQAKAGCLNIMNDTLYDIGGSWSYQNQPDYASIARTDTNGNLILDKPIWETNYLLLRCVKTFDNKELFAGAFFDDDGYRKIYLHKFNENLEYDTIYTQTFDYDYKCDNLPIVSDTIGIEDCGVWTGLPGTEEFRQAKHLETYPNPTSSTLNITLPEYTAEERPWGPLTSRQYNFRYFKYSVIKIYDVYGREMQAIDLENQQGNKLKVDVSSYAEGIYLINLYENNKQMASGKFMKK